MARIAEARPAVIAAGRLEHLGRAPSNPQKSGKRAAKPWGRRASARRGPCRSDPVTQEIAKKKRTHRGDCDGAKGGGWSRSAPSPPNHCRRSTMLSMPSSCSSCPFSRKNRASFFQIRDRRRRRCAPEVFAARPERWVKKPRDGLAQRTHEKSELPEGGVSADNFQPIVHHHVPPQARPNASANAVSLRRASAGTERTQAPCREILPALAGKPSRAVAPLSLQKPRKGAPLSSSLVDWPPPPLRRRGRTS